MCILIGKLSLAADVLKCRVVNAFRDCLFIRCGLCLSCDVTCVILVIRTVLRTRTDIPGLLQTENILTVAELFH